MDHQSTSLGSPRRSGASVPKSMAKSMHSSLFLVCAHHWEAEPFLQMLGLKEIQRTPFPLYVRAHGFREVQLTVCGNGYSRALMATTAWLSLRCQGAQGGLLTPPVVVANFGTAGAYDKSWHLGQTLLVSKVARAGTAGAIYPERLVEWEGQETECRTVEVRQTEIEEAYRSSPLFDMEAYGVAESAICFLSSSHLVVGKCVLDRVGDPTETKLSIPELRSRVATEYAQGAELFLEHALAHQAALSGDERRLAAQRLSEEVAQLLEFAGSLVHLTVAQQRLLEQSLRGVLASGERDAEWARLLLAAELGQEQGAPKSRVKTVLEGLLQRLAETL